jgi:hypothetical protein
MKKTIVKLLGISGFVIVGFFALSYVFQHVTEVTLAKNMSGSEEMNQTDDENSDFAEEEIMSGAEIEAELAKMTLEEYFADGYYSEELIKKFEEQFQLDITKATYGELSPEQEDFLHYERYLIDEGERAILQRNEAMADGEVALDDATGEYAYSLQTSLMDMAAMPEPERKGVTKIMIDICEEHKVDPDGKIKDLNADIIKELEDALIEASSHGK